MEIMLKDMKAAVGSSQPQDATADTHVPSQGNSAVWIVGAGESAITSTPQTLLQQSPIGGTSAKTLPAQPVSPAVVDVNKAYDLILQERTTAQQVAHAQTANDRARVEAAHDAIIAEWLTRKASAPARPAGDATWGSDLNDALNRAGESGSVVLCLFEGVTWCPMSRILESKLFATQEFKTYAAGNLALVRISLPKSRGSDPVVNARFDLAKRMAVNGVPTAVLLRPNGTEIGRFGYADCSAEQYIEAIRQAIER
jgi:hypothetical protein